MAVGDLVNFDGSTYLARGAGLTGVADGKQGTLSLWVVPGSDGSFQTLIKNEGSTRLQFQQNSVNKLVLQAYNSAGTEILSVRSNTALLASEGLRHIWITFDLANSGHRAFYIDGAAESAIWSTYTNDNIEYSGPTEWFIGTATSGLFKVWAGCLGEFWFADQYLDPATYLSAFIDSGFAVDLGSDGSTPTGSSPLICLNKSTANWHTNAGTAGGFTENGALTTCSAGFAPPPMSLEAAQYSAAGQPLAFTERLTLEPATFNVAGQPLEFSSNFLLDNGTVSATPGELLFSAVEPLEAAVFTATGGTLDMIPALLLEDAAAGAAAGDLDFVWHMPLGAASVTVQAQPIDFVWRMPMGPGVVSALVQPLDIFTYDDWLQRRGVPRIVLIELVSTTTTYRIGSRTFITEPDDDPANTVYYGALLDEVTIERRLSGPYGLSGAAFNGGTLKFANGDRRYDAFIDEHWVSGRIMFRDPRWRIGQFYADSQRFNGRIENVEADGESVQMTLADLYQDLQKPAQAVPEWFGERIGQFRPLCYGKVLNVAPHQTGTSHPDFYIHEYGDCEDEVTARYSNQKPFTSPSVVSRHGYWFELDTMPSGALTIDCKGVLDDGGSWIQTLADALQHLLTREIALEFGCARDGSATGLQLDVLASAINDYYNGQPVWCVSQTDPAPPWSSPPVGSGTTIPIIDYNGATRWLTISGSTPWLADVPTRQAGDLYHIDLGAGMAKKRVGLLTSGQIDTAAFGQFAIDFPGLIGLFVDNNESVVQVLDRALSPAAHHNFTPQGKLTVGTLVDPSTATATLDLTQRNLVGGMPKITQVHRPVYDMKLGYARNHTVAKGAHDDLSSAREEFVTREYRVVPRQDVSIYQTDPQAEVKTFGTVLQETDDAITEMDRVWPLFSVQRKEYEVPADTAPMALPLGGVLNLDAPVHDLDGGKKLVMLGLRESLLAERTVAETWG